MWSPDMVTERQIQETIARCVSLMVFYHNSEKSAQLSDDLADQARAVAGWASEANFGETEAGERIFRPVASELVARYGEGVGCRLRDEFLAAIGTDRRRPLQPPRGRDGRL
jgi:hypothetical protein